jgi:HSP20 family protein
MVRRKPIDAGVKAVFDNFFSSKRPLFSLSQNVWNPPADFYETADSVVIKMEVAGASRDRMEIAVEGSFLVIRGCRHEDTALPKESYLLMEIRYGRFERVFGLPTKTLADKIQAQYHNGFLVVTIPKRAAAAARDIPIEVAEK